MGIWSDGKPVYTEPANSVDVEELLGLHAMVHPDGNEATLTFHTTTGQTKLHAQIEQISAVQAEIHSAALLMQYRQSMKSDAGEGVFDDLLRTALRPAEITILIDSKTGDRQFVMQFPDRLPIVIRLTPEQLEETLANLSTEAMRSAN